MPKSYGTGSATRTKDEEPDGLLDDPRKGEFMCDTTDTGYETDSADADSAENPPVTPDTIRGFAREIVHHAWHVPREDEARFTRSREAAVEGLTAWFVMIAEDAGISTVDAFRAEIARRIHENRLGMSLVFDKQSCIWCGRFVPESDCEGAWACSEECAGVYEKVSAAQERQSWKIERQRRKIEDEWTPAQRAAREAVKRADYEAGQARLPTYFSAASRASRRFGPQAG